VEEIRGVHKRSGTPDALGLAERLGVPLSALTNALNTLAHKTEL
jgi:hypothetical protein